jgi:HlyD family secretion protein
MLSAVGRRLWIFVIAALALTAILVFVSSRGSTPRVNVVKVARENLSSTVTTNGKVEPISPVPFHAGFSTSVEKVFVPEGQQVRRGQPLFTLDDKSARAELNQARADLSAQEEALRIAKAGGQAAQVAKAAADLEKAKASRDQLSRDNAVLVRLAAEKAATPMELEQNRLALAQAAADVQSLEKIRQTVEVQAQSDTSRVALLVQRGRDQVQDLEGQLKTAHGAAPIDGTVYSLPIHMGDFVKEGDLLAEMADLHQVRVRAFIDEPDLGRISSHQPVDILWDAHPDRVWTGSTEILPKAVVSHGTRNVGELLCSVNSDQPELIPNVTVDVRIKISERPNVLVIPRGAIFIDGSKRFVFVVEGDRLHRRDIKVGVANPTMIEVDSGLKEGEVVALPGDIRFKENLRIRSVFPE